MTNRAMIRPLAADHPFVWRGERSEDEGSTWLRTAEYQMSRVAEVDKARERRDE